MSKLNFEKLGNFRALILRAELGALLHNVGKITIPFRKSADAPYTAVAGQATVLNLIGLNQLSRVAEVERELSSAGLSSLLRAPLMKTEEQSPGLLDTAQLVIGSLSEFHLPKILMNMPERCELCNVMRWSHEQSSGQEKRAVEQEVAGQGIHIDHPHQERNIGSTVFGHEHKLRSPEELLKSLGDLGMTADRWRHLKAKALEIMSGNPADGQLPINDVTVADIGEMGAAFFKAGLAQSLLEEAWPQPDPKDPDECPFRWMLFRIALDGPSFVSKAVRVPDILIRRQRIDEILDHIRETFETEWLLGNEIYRDTSGSVFLLPGLFQDASEQQALEEKVQKAWNKYQEQLDQDTSSDLAQELSYQSQWGGNGFALGPVGENSYQLGPLIERQAPSPAVAAEHLSHWWRNATNRQICSVCGLRPMGGPDEKSGERKVCDTCEQRRQSRSLSWLKGSSRTIWLEEVQDVNGRVALITGRFRLNKWLCEEGYIERTLFLGHEKGKPDSKHWKSPSFARIARVWRTTKRFWADCLDSIASKLDSPEPRLLLKGQYSGRKPPARQHTYLLELDGYRFSAVCKEGGSNPELVLAENLERVKQQLEVKDLGSFLRNRTLRLEIPTGYGSENQRSGTFAVTDVTEFAPEGSAGWKPLIEIRLDPDTVMFLVPAKSAWAAAREMQRRYDDEMGKVRNRLGIDIGLVYAPAMTPLHALLDAGRRMMSGMKREAEPWEVKLTERLPDSIKLTFKNGAFVQVPIKVKDSRKNLDDEWYPFFQRFTESGVESVHINELKVGQEVRFEPSSFDFEFLETSSRRFEIEYDLSSGGRLGRAGRPWRIDELERLEAIWGILKDGLAKTQIKTLDGLLTEKRRFWRQLPAGFIKDCLRNCEWRREPTDTEFQTLCDAAQSGMLADVIEIFVGAQKEEVKKEKELVHA